MANNTQTQSLIRKMWEATRIPAAINNTADKLGQMGFPAFSFMVRHSIFLMFVFLALGGLAYRFVASDNLFERAVCALAAVLILMRAGLALASSKA